MRLYHSPRYRWVFLLAALLLTGCASPRVTQGVITVEVLVDQGTESVEVPAGSTVEFALSAGGVVLGSLDRTDPPLYTVLGEGSQVEVVRVEEEFSVEQEVIPFENQVLQNESLPAGEEYWLQLGENGLREITTRRVLENGVEVSNSVVKSVIVDQPLPQIKMIGVQKPFAPISIPGRLAYLLNGSAWVMEGTTSSRRQVVPTGDLDGRVFSLSEDGSWLLFTRSVDQDAQPEAGAETSEETINSLWVARVDEGEELLIDLGVSNVVHFADWRPGSSNMVAYSTVEPRAAAPGWQANNDVGLVTFSQAGFVRHLPDILESNPGGQYGWWGTSFSWAPDGQYLAYSRPDGIGTLDIQTGVLSPVVEMSPFQTFGDWAWVPGISWGPAGDLLYSVEHLPPQESQHFDMLAVTFSESQQQSAGDAEETGEPANVGENQRLLADARVTLTPETGMFAYPSTSPVRELPTGESAFEIAFLQAIFPAQSESSRYQLIVMDRDGSNRRLVFPQQGPGLEPQRAIWSPEPLVDRAGFSLAIVYQNNLWLVDADGSDAWQITGDGLTNRVDWK